MKQFCKHKTEFLRKTLCLFTAAFLVFSGMAAADIVHAEEDNGDGTIFSPIDANTGEAISDDDSSVVESEVRVDNDVTYEPEQKVFLYQFGDSESTILTCTAADGMYVNNSVTATIGSGLTAELYRNGHEDDQELSEISKPGSYVLMVHKGSSSEFKSISFRIIDEYTDAHMFRCPSGFTITKVRMNQESQNVNSSYVSMEEEGTYVVSYVCDASHVTYSFQATVDHTAPVLALAAVDEQGIARSAVDLSDCEDGAVMYITKDGSSIEASDQLTEPGEYEITVQDQAGNVTYYEFSIHLYFTYSRLLVWLLLAAAICGLAAYVYISRRNLQVR